MVHRAFCALTLLAASVASCETLAVPPDSPRWELQGRAKAGEYLGRKCLALNGGAAILKDFEMRDAIVDVDVATSTGRGFVGFFFRIANDGAFGEEVGRSTTDLALPALSTFRPENGTPFAWRFTAPRPSCS